MRWKIGEALLQAGLISPDDLRRALAERERAGEHLGEVLVRMGLATETQIAAALARQLGFTHVDLVSNPPDPTAAALVSEELSHKHLCVALGVQGDVLTVAMADPLQFSLVREIEVRTGYRVRPVIATPGQIAGALRQPPSMAMVSGESRHGDQPTSTSEAKRFVTEALDSGASEISIEPVENGALVRTRHDERAVEVIVTTREAGEALIAFIKAHAGLEPESRLAQQGRFRAQGTDYRVTTLPAVDGERVVLRTQSTPQRLALEALGFTSSALVDLRGILRRRGLVIVAGPSNSGKTTTLASLAEAIAADQNRDAPTVLDDVAGDEQMSTVLEAAKTGTVLVSVCVDDAAGGLMGATVAGFSPSQLSAVLGGVIEQRLVRRLCEHCRRLTHVSTEIRQALGLTKAAADDLPFFAAVGCEQCGHSGYRGLTAIFQVMAVDDEIRQLLGSIDAPRVRHELRGRRFVTLGENGLSVVTSGVTTAEELVRVLGSVGPTRTLCAGCGSPVAPDFASCPHCGERLGVECQHCGRALQPAWTVCPYCARPAGQEP